MSEPTTDAMNTQAFDEHAARRPDWVGGWPIRLANGQDWLLAYPAINWKPSDHEPDEPVMVTNPPLDMDTLRELANPDTASDRIPALCLSLGRSLLRRNYSLDDDQVVGLLELPSDDPAGSPTVAVLRQTAAMLADGLKVGGEARLRALEFMAEATVARLKLVMQGSLV